MIGAAAPAAACGLTAEGGILRIEFCAQADVEWSTVRLLVLTRCRLFSCFGSVEQTTPKEMLRGCVSLKQIWSQWPNLHVVARC
jgi:hypothetical protein